MKYLLLISILILSMDSNIIFDFKESSDIENWIIVDDVVMGGKSSGSFKINPEGHGMFEGTISIENNGGFSSVRYNFDKLEVKKYDKIILKIKGDNKNYQFRIKSNSNDYYSYIYSFTTSEDWEEVHIPLKDMYPSFRGRKLNQPNFSSDYIEEIAFLIGNKKAEKFKLEIDKIEFGRI